MPKKWRCSGDRLPKALQILMNIEASFTSDVTLLLRLYLKASLTSATLALLCFKQSLEASSKTF